MADEMKVELTCQVGTKVVRRVGTDSVNVQFYTRIINPEPFTSKWQYVGTKAVKKTDFCAFKDELLECNIFPINYLEQQEQREEKSEGTNVQRREMVRGLQL